MHRSALVSARLWLQPPLCSAAPRRSQARVSERNRVPKQRAPQTFTAAYIEQDDEDEPDYGYVGSGRGAAADDDYYNRRRVDDDEVSSTRAAAAAVLAASFTGGCNTLILVLVSL